MEIKSKIILLTEEELVAAVQQANIPLIERLEAVEKKLAQEKLCYTSNEIGKLLGVTSRTIRTWIVEGKQDMAGKLHHLRAVELLRGRYTIRLSDVQEFIHFF